MKQEDIRQRFAHADRALTRARHYSSYSNQLDIAR